MTILRELSITLQPAEVLEEQGGGRRRPPRRELLAAAEQAVDLTHSLIAPAVASEEWVVRAVDGPQVLLAAAENGNATQEWHLTVGPKADLLAPAQRLVAAVYTIGPALEIHVRQLQAAGENLLAFMLDSAGVMALGAVGELLHQQIELRAQEFGWGTSAALSPGSLVGWSIDGQRELCALLPLDEIGVRLNDHCVLEPFKSVSLVVGLGPGYDSKHVGSVCAFCCLAERCWRRR